MSLKPQKPSEIETQVSGSPAGIRVFPSDENTENFDETVFLSDIMWNGYESDRDATIDAYWVAYNTLITKMGGIKNNDPNQHHTINSELTVSEGLPYNLAIYEDLLVSSAYWNENGILVFDRNLEAILEKMVWKIDVYVELLNANTELWSVIFDLPGRKSLQDLTEFWIAILDLFHSQAKNTIATKEELYQLWDSSQNRLINTPQAEIETAAIREGIVAADSLAVPSALASAFIYALQCVATSLVMDDRVNMVGALHTALNNANVALLASEHLTDIRLVSDDLVRGLNSIEPAITLLSTMMEQTSSTDQRNLIKNLIEQLTRLGVEFDNAFASWPAVSACLAGAGPLLASLKTTISNSYPRIRELSDRINNLRSEITG